MYRGAEYNVDFNPKIKIELVLDAEMVGKVVETIRDAANSGKIGDGKIFIMDVEDFVILPLCCSPIHYFHTDMEKSN